MMAFVDTSELLRHLSRSQCENDFVLSLRSAYRMQTNRKSGPYSGLSTVCWHQSAFRHRQPSASSSLDGSAWPRSERPQTEGGPASIGDWDSRYALGLFHDFRWNRTESWKTVVTRFGPLH